MGAAHWNCWRGIEKILFYSYNDRFHLPRKKIILVKYRVWYYHTISNETPSRAKSVHWKSCADCRSLWRCSPALGLSPSSNPVWWSIFNLNLYLYSPLENCTVGGKWSNRWFSGSGELLGMGCSILPPSSILRFASARCLNPFVGCTSSHLWGKCSHNIFNRPPG